MFCGKRVQRRVVLVALLAGLLVIGGSSGTNITVNAGQNYDPAGIIRLHVIADSDTPQDQQLKLRVRDAILASAGEQLACADGITSARKIVSYNLQTIAGAAKSEIERDGKDYDVAVVIGDYDFPARFYSNGILPAGNYEALRVIIGEGKGQNWWCVLFPPMCLVDVKTAEKNAEPSAKRLPAADDHGRQDVEIRWRLKEIFDFLRQRLTALLSRV